MIPTMLRTLIPIWGSEPKNWAPPNAKTPPSAATNQYPVPFGRSARVLKAGELVVNAAVRASAAPDTEP
jgi:hypothetical protein